MLSTEFAAVKNKKDLGNRKHVRVNMQKSASVILEPNGLEFECTVLDISEGGVRLNVGGLAMPKIFMLELAPQIRRLCKLAWRRREIIGASFVAQKDREKSPGRAQAPSEAVAKSVKCPPQVLVGE
jgi:hypothetical protein